MAFPKLNSKTKLLLILFLICLASLFYLFFSSSQPSKTSSIPNLSLEASLPSITPRITLAPNYISLLDKTPSKLKIYSASLASPSVSSELDRLGPKLNLSLNTKTPVRFYSNPDQSRLLIIDRPDVSLSYQTDPNLSPVSYHGNSLPTLEKSIENGTKFILNLGLLPNPKPALSRVVYAKQLFNHVEPSSATDFDLIEIPFYQEVSGVPIQLEGYTTPPLNLIFGQSSQVVGFQYSPKIFSNFLETVTLDRITPAQLNSSIKNNNFQILNILSDAHLFQIDDISDINLQALFLEYRFDSASRLLVPYLQLQGETQVNKTFSSRILLATPAIDTSKLPQH